MLIKIFFGLFSFLLFLQMSPSVGLAQTKSAETELAISLKMEANHNLTRLKSLKSEKANQKIYDREREKGLSSFIEEQEKWDMSRERGLSEYRKQKKQSSPQLGGPEYLADQKVKKAQALEMEKSRRIQVRVTDQVYSENKELIQKLEAQELGLNEERPRYSLRKRAQNRWVKHGSVTGSGTSSKSRSAAPTYIPPAPPPFDDFPPPPVTDYQPIPAAMDGFEQIPPPPVPLYEPYGDGATPFDSGFGDVPPPPPPPPLDYDF